MSLSLTNSKFPILCQQGPFATRSTPPSTSLFSHGTREFLRDLREKELLTKYRVIRNQIFDFLDVDSYAGIQALLNDEPRRAEVNRRGYALLGNMFGIKGSEREIVSKVKNYSRTADSVIRYLKTKVMAKYASYIEMTNEIDTICSPVDLLLIIFDERFHKKARFEAKRKLLLMNLAGSIEQREQETKVEKNFSDFLDFLNKRVWSPELLIGELDVSFLYSHHRPENFSCSKVEVVGLKQAQSIQLQKGEKLTLIKRRRFSVGDRDFPIYVSIRKKPPEAKVLKLLRKGEENPAVAVDDELGLMAVLDSIAEVRLFQEHLTKSAIKDSSFMTLEDISDTLTGGKHHGSVGSSSSTPMFKFFARMGGMRVEFIIHTNMTYLNYIYQRNVSHDEYEVKRIFETGVAELLFPKDIYHLDMEEVKNRQMKLCRRQIEEG